MSAARSSQLLPQKYHCDDIESTREPRYQKTNASISVCLRWTSLISEPEQPRRGCRIRLSRRVCCTSLRQDVYVNSDRISRRVPDGRHESALLHNSFVARTSSHDHQVFSGH